jgi:hypothetical protein
MPIATACTSCNKRLTVKDESAGKRVKCPGCGGVFLAVASAAQPAVAAARSAVPSAAPKPAQKHTAATATLPVVRPATVTAIHDEDEDTEPSLLDAKKEPGKRPRKDEDDEEERSLLDDENGKGKKKPTKQSRKDDEEEKPAKVSRKRGKDVEDDADEDAVGEWGEDLLKDQDLPKNMRSDIRKALLPGEHITWAIRARMDILMAHARKAQIIGIVMLSIGVILTGVLVGMMIYLGPPAVVIVVISFFLLVLVLVSAVGVGMIMMPRHRSKHERTRPCYLVAVNALPGRLLVHPGIGMDIPMPAFVRKLFKSLAKSMRKTSKAAIDVTPYTFFDLTKMHRFEEKHFPGAGDIVLGLDQFERSALYRLSGIDDVKKVERLIREKVLHPTVDALLSGASADDLMKGSKNKGPKDDQGMKVEDLPPDQNVKSLMADDKMTRNLKKFRTAIADKLDEMSGKPKKKVESELTDGEELLWVDKPQAKVKGRGFIGALMNKAVRKEPTYELYAITNRRVLLWSTKDTSVDAGSGNGHLAGTGDMSRRGPLSYYSPDLKNIGLEEDERIEDGGSIIFKSIKVVITTTTTSGGGRRGGPVRTKSSKREEIHNFGILRIRNVQAVMRLLYDRLIAPCK